MLISIQYISSGQDNTSLKGKVISGKNTPVPYAAVTLMRQDSSVINGAITDDNGKFEIAPAAIGMFLVRVSGIGIKTVTKAGIIISADKPKVDLGDINVKSNATQLNEVKITDSRPLMEMGIDKKVFNVEKDLTSQGGSASDVLQNVPSVSVDVDGNVSLRAKSNVTILIDGKPATLLGGDDATALQSLPASSIDKIEVITNPSAKYDATGMTGIINIITKREKKMGLNGSVMLGAGTRDKYNGNLNLNLKNEKWNVFLNSSYRQNRRYRHNTIENYSDNDNSYSYSYEDMNRIFNGFFNTIGAEYIIDTNNSITLTENINKMRWGGNGTTDFRRYNDAGNLFSRQERFSDNGGGPFSISSSLDYKRKFKVKERELTANTTFVRSWMKRTQYYATETYDQTEALVEGPIIQNAPGNSNNRNFNSQVDYVSPMFTENGKLEAGLKSQLFWLESDNQPVVDSAGDGPVVDSILMNGYDYTQQTYAAYTSWGDQVGKFRYKAGLRLEYMFYEGTSVQVNGQRYFNDFLNLFPSAFVSYELPKKQSVYLSYTRRTDRPRFWHLLPYVDLSNPQDTSVGNPNLVPEFIHNTELSYNKTYEQGHNIILSAYYQYTQNLIERYRIVYDSTNTSFSQRRNLNAGITYGLDLTGQFQIINRVWDATVNVNLFRNEIKGSNIDPSLDNSGYGYFAKLNTSVRLPKDFSVQLNANYNGPRVEAQGTRREVYWFDVALRKSFWEGRGNLVLNVSDIFNTRVYTTDYDFGNSYQLRIRDNETRIGNISFTYRFGSNESKGFGRKRSSRNGKKADLEKEANKDRDNIKEGDDDNGGGF